MTRIAILLGAGLASLGGAGQRLTLPPERAMLEPMGYPGGKSGAGVYQTLINLMPPHEVYIEPFLGGGAVMRLKRPAALNIGVDLDGDVIRGWDVSTAGNSDGAGGIAKSDVARRRGSPEVAMPAAIAKSGEGRSSRIAISGGSGRADLLAVSGDGRRPSPGMAARSASLETPGPDPEFRFIAGNGIEFLRSYPFTGRELVYCDPPYLYSVRSSKRAYYRHELGEDAEHRELLAVLRSLPCAVIVSGYRSRLYAEELAGWRTATYQTVNRAGALVTEWLWYNYPTPLALHDYRYLGDDYRERERIGRKTERWSGRLARMAAWERAWLTAAVSTDYRGRERMKRKQQRWMAALTRMRPLERRALLSAIASNAQSGDRRSVIAISGEGTRP